MKLHPGLASVPLLSFAASFAAPVSCSVPYMYVLPSVSCSVPASAASLYVLFGSCLGLARTIYVRCIYGNIGRKITKDTVVYGVYIRFWPTLLLCSHLNCLYLGLAKVVYKYVFTVFWQGNHQMYGTYISYSHN